MKLFFIILFSIFILIAFLQILIYRNTANTEMHEFEVINDYQTFELRKYEPALFASVAIEAGNYKSNSTQGFRKLAGYIFGGNNKNQSIAMTTPVTMTIEDKMKMKFKVPKGMSQADLPTPSNSEIAFEAQDEKVVAAISFNGWANDDRIEEKIERLKQLLHSEGLVYKEPFSYLGYNPPYQLIMRKNEIVVEVVK